MTQELPGPSTGFENIVPILWVSSLEASVEYYVAKLGFAADWRDAGMASVSRGGHAIMLCEGAQGHRGAWVWVGVEDAQALFDEYTARGAIVHEPPVNHPWAYEMRIADPDGNVLRFGSEPLEQS
jgi:catechol 2,3-dioxygenase-like lactoylglutathione lyase family enzyme